MPHEEVARDAAVRERECNVIVDASAGTGKTSLIVDRIVELIAPCGSATPIPIERIAAVTFTRKAAGELRVRTRQRILDTLATLPEGSHRTDPLRRALGGLDTAEIGTIHSFADRLLRRWPAKAGLDPRYQLHDEPDVLVEETFEMLVHAAETGALADLLHGAAIADRAIEATRTVLDLRRAGIALRSRSSAHWTHHGLDGFVAELVERRDVSVEDPVEPVFDRGAFDQFADELARWAEGVAAETRGGRWFAKIVALVRKLSDETDPITLFHELVPVLSGGPRGRKPEAKKGEDFENDARGWDAWKAFDGDERTKNRVRDTPLRADLVGPLLRWMAHRLVRLRPVVLHLYERVKARSHAVDHVDLLLRLRDLLRDDGVVRRECQQLFDHIFVDEFQDTDPLQAEVILFLCEREALASTWTDVVPAPGTLTIVGDPKQSIYRFRRADIGAYQRAVEIVERGPFRSLQLSRSWRSVPALVDWLGSRFEVVLGKSDGPRFSASTGEVAHAPLAHGRTGSSPKPVHVVTVDLGRKGVAEEHRVLEADALARYVRWLVELSGMRVQDRWTQSERAIGYGDVGVLAITTTGLRVLFDAFDRDRVPYAARGGTLFLADPHQRHFLLGLVALSDRDDGVATAAILRPPFFAVDLADLARAQRDEPADRATNARAIISELRRRRFERGIGGTARALLEETGYGRSIALGPNGVQRLRGLRELCMQLEALGLEEQLDFDAAVERVRPWIESPRRLERPHPVSNDVVRVMTIHQAKGLEFPIVVLWDANASSKDRRADNSAWTVEREGRGWSLSLGHLQWEEPSGLGIARHERRMRDAERKRLVYVGATRARDLLVVARHGAFDDRSIYGTLFGACDHSSIKLVAPHS